MIHKRKQMHTFHSTMQLVGVESSSAWVLAEFHRRSNLWWTKQSKELELWTMHSLDNGVSIAYKTQLKKRSRWECVSICIYNNSRLDFMSIVNFISLWAYDDCCYNGCVVQIILTQEKKIQRLKEVVKSLKEQLQRCQVGNETLNGTLTSLAENSMEMEQHMHMDWMFLYPCSFLFCMASLSLSVGTFLEGGVNCFRPGAGD